MYVLESQSFVMKKTQLYFVVRRFLLQSFARINSEKKYKERERVFLLPLRVIFAVKNLRSISFLIHLQIIFIFYHRLEQERRDHEMAVRLAKETNGHVEGSPPQLRR